MVASVDTLYGTIQAGEQGEGRQSDKSNGENYKEEECEKARTVWSCCFDDDEVLLNSCQTTYPSYYYFYSSQLLRQWSLLVMYSITNLLLLVVLLCCIYCFFTEEITIDENIALSTPPLLLHAGYIHRGKRRAIFRRSSSSGKTHQGNSHIC